MLAEHHQTLTTADLAIDPPGTRVRDNTLAVGLGRNISVSVVIPDIKREITSSECLRFAEETFNLSDTLYRSSRNASILLESSVGSTPQQPVLTTRFSATKPGDYCVELNSLSSPRLLSFDQLTEEDEEVNNLSEMLSLLTRNLPAAVKSYGHQHSTEFRRNFAIAHSHAYALISQFCLDNDLPHIFHSSVDNHRLYRVGSLDAQDHQILAFFGSPLRKAACFLNVMQLACFLKTGDRLFSAAMLAEVAANINAIFEDKYSLERKKVVHQIAADVKPLVGITGQKESFRSRAVLLADHVEHSPPFPVDAWKLLLASAVSGEVRESILRHAAENPHYARDLLMELRKQRKLAGKEYRLTETVNKDKREINLELRVKTPTVNNGKPVKTILTRAYGNFFLERHRLHLEALQNIVGFHSELPDPQDSPLSYLNVDFLNSDRLRSYLDEAFYPAMEEAGMSMDLYQGMEAGSHFFRIVFTDRAGRRYSYETAGVNDKEQKYKLNDLFNYIVKFTREMGIEFNFPDSIYVFSDDRFKDSGFENRFCKFESRPNKRQVISSCEIPLIGDKLRLVDIYTHPPDSRETNQETLPIVEGRLHDLFFRTLN